MPTDLGTIAAYGTAGGNDELKQLLAERFKRALQAQAEEDRQRQFDIQEKQLASQADDRRLAREDRQAAAEELKRRTEAANFGSAVDNSASGSDLTLAADTVKGNPYAAPLVQGLKREGTSASLPTINLGGTTARGEIAPTGATRGPGVRLLNPKAPPQVGTRVLQTMKDGQRTIEIVPDVAGTTRPDQPPTSGAGASALLTPEDKERVERGATAVLERRMSPDQAARYYGGMGGNAAVVKRAIIDRVLQRDETFNLAGAESDYRFGANPSTQRTVRNINNIVNSIPIMENLIKKAELGGVPVINRATLSARRNIFADSDVSNYEFMQTALADEFGQILGGGGSGSATSDRKIQLAIDALNKDMTPEMWKGVLSTARDVFATRRAALTKGTYMEDKPSASTSKYKAGDTVMYQGKQRSVQSVNPDGTLVLAPLAPTGGRGGGG